MDRPPAASTRKQVAKIAGVSTTTVTNVLNHRGNVSAAIRERVLAVATQLGYRPHPAARALALKRYEKIAIVSDSLANPFFGALFDELAKELHKDGYKAISLHTTWVDLDYLSRIIRGHADGMIILDGTLPPPVVEAIQREGIPLVAHGYEDETRVPKVEPDFREGVRSAVNHLVDLGHTRIAYLSPKSPETDLRRYREFCGAMRERGVTVDPSLVVFHPEPADETSAVGYQAGSELLRRNTPFTAIFAYSDTLAIGAAAALRESGRAVPREVSLVGWDDITFARYMNPPLTTVHTAVDETARLLKRMLCERIEGREVEDISRVATRLVLRSSTAAPRGTPKGPDE